MPTSGEPVQPSVGELKRMLELELDVRARPFQGCWPFVVALVGLVLATAMLLAWL